MWFFIRRFLQYKMSVFFSIVLIFGLWIMKYRNELDMTVSQLREPCVIKLQCSSECRTKTARLMIFDPLETGKRYFSIIRIRITVFWSYTDLQNIRAWTIPYFPVYQKYTASLKLNLSWRFFFSIWKVLHFWYFTSLTNNVYFLSSDTNKLIKKISFVNILTIYLRLRS